MPTKPTILTDEDERIVVVTLEWQARPVKRRELDVLVHWADGRLDRLLATLRRRRLVKVVTEGRHSTYALTKEGKREAKRIRARWPKPRKAR